MVLGIVCQRWTLSAPDSENRIILLQILGLNDSARISPTGVGCPVYSASHERLPQDERTTTCNFCVPDRLCNGHIVEAEALSLHPCPLTSVQTTGKSKAPWNSVATCVAVRNSCLPLTLLCSDVRAVFNATCKTLPGPFLNNGLGTVKLKHGESWTNNHKIHKRHHREKSRASNHLVKLGLPKA